MKKLITAIAALLLPFNVAAQQYPSPTYKDVTIQQNLNLPSKPANNLFVSPDGSAGAPTFRSMVAGDMPNAGVITGGVVTGTFPSLTLAPGSVTNSMLQQTFGTGVSGSLANNLNGTGGLVAAVACTGTNDDAAIQAAYAGQVKRVVINGTCGIGTSFTVPNGVVLAPSPGSQINVAVGQTLTIRGVIDPAVYNGQIFAGSGTVTGLAFVRPVWFGVTAASSDNSAAITKAIASVHNALGSDGPEYAIQFDCGVFKIGSTIVFNPSASVPLRIRGCGDTLGTRITANSVFTGISAMQIVAANVGTPMYDFTLEGISLVNEVQSGGPTAGLIIGSGVFNETAGIVRKRVSNVMVGGFGLNIVLQNTRLYEFRNVTTWPEDNAGAERASSAGLRMQANLVGSFVGDFDCYNCQFVAPFGGGTPTGSGVDLRSTGGSTNVSGIRFHGSTFYGGAIQFNARADAGCIVSDIWLNPGTQFEGPVPGTSTGINLDNGGTIRNFHAAGLYMSGNGFNNHFKAANAGGTILFNIFVHNNMLANPNPAFSSVDIRGTGGTAYGIQVSDNLIYEPGTGANAGIYLENTKQTTANGNQFIGVGATTRGSLVQFNGASSDQLTAVGNNDGGMATTSVSNTSASPNNNIANNL